MSGHKTTDRAVSLADDTPLRRRAGTRTGTAAFDYRRLGEHQDPDLGTALAGALAAGSHSGYACGDAGRHRVLQPDSRHLPDARTPPRYSAGRSFPPRLPMSSSVGGRSQTTSSGVLVPANGETAPCHSARTRCQSRRRKLDFDVKNRGAFAKSRAGVPAAPRFKPSQITREVISWSTREFGDHPGRLDRLDLACHSCAVGTAGAALPRSRLPRLGATRTPAGAAKRALPTASEDEADAAQRGA